MQITFELKKMQFEGLYGDAASLSALWFHFLSVSQLRSLLLVVSGV